MQTAILVVAVLLLVAPVSCSTACEIRLVRIGGKSGDVSIACAGPAAPVPFGASAQLLPYLNSTAGGMALPTYFTQPPFLCFPASSLAFQNHSIERITLFVGLVQTYGRT
jgi:hypothetical protein